MLRRAATTIKLTPEDILEYDKSVSIQEKGDQTSYLKDEQLQEHINEPEVSMKYKQQTRNDRMGVGNS